MEKLPLRGVFTKVELFDHNFITIVDVDALLRRFAAETAAVG